ncbi:putative deoxyribonuclease TATDN2 [Penaeus monodon]|uniref:putative deoxyribonuclease TATDN2 n=1 Tax=Penaeus monodon TaxID=6687 RepID=UPI0018A70C85|nr:putative deoxyribonuclease TATDN2 [Penaeus monodon]
MERKDMTGFGKVADFSLRSLFDKTMADKKPQQQVSEVEKKTVPPSSAETRDDLPFSLKSRSVVFSMKALIEKGRTKYREEKKIEQTPTQTREKSKQQKEKYLVNVLKLCPAKKIAKTVSDCQVTLDSDKGQDPTYVPTCAANPSLISTPSKEMKSHRYSILKRLKTSKPYEKGRMNTASESVLQQHKETYSPFSKYKLLSNNNCDQEKFTEIQQCLQRTAGRAQTDKEALYSRNFCYQGSSMQRYLKLSYDQHKLMTEKYSPGFIDTHCHLDFLFSKCNHIGTYAKYQSTREGQDAFPVSYEGCIANFCQPWTFKRISWWENFLAESNVWAAFGCHPHYSSSFGDEEEGYLRHALQHKKALALGEIGLDYSCKNNHSRELQQIVFRRQLKIALEFNKPLVIHCRDADEDCINILMEIVPRDYVIHRHCFTGNWREAERWLSTFYNLYLGITALVTYPYTERGCNVQDVVSQMPLNRLLLETDAPYFRPHCYQGPGRWSHPGMAIHVAAQVASLREKSVQEILAFTRQNTKKVYGV